MLHTPNERGRGTPSVQQLAADVAVLSACAFVSAALVLIYRLTGETFVFLVPVAPVLGVVPLFLFDVIQRKGNFVARIAMGSLVASVGCQLTLTFSLMSAAFAIAEGLLYFVICLIFFGAIRWLLDFARKRGSETNS